MRDEVSWEEQRLWLRAADLRLVRAYMQASGEKPPEVPMHCPSCGWRLGHEIPWFPHGWQNHAGYRVDSGRWSAVHQPCGELIVWPPLPDGPSWPDGSPVEDD